MKNTILFLMLILVLFGCGLEDAKKDAEKQSATFHKELRAKNTAKLLDFIHEDGLAADSREEWIALFEKVYSLGEIKNVKEGMGFDSNVENGTHTVKLNYILEFDQGSLNEEIVWRDSKSGKMKILSIHFEKN